MGAYFTGLMEILCRKTSSQASPLADIVFLIQEPRIRKRCNHF